MGSKNFATDEVDIFEQLSAEVEIKPSFIELDEDTPFAESEPIIERGYKIIRRPLYVKPELLGMGRGNLAVARGEDIPETTFLHFPIPPRPEYKKRLLTLSIVSFIFNQLPLGEDRELRRIEVRIEATVIKDKKTNKPKYLSVGSGGLWLFDKNVAKFTAAAGLEVACYAYSKKIVL